METFNKLTKQQKMELMSLVYDLNEKGIRCSATMNQYDWMSVYIQDPKRMQVFTIGGCNSASFEDGYKKLSSLLG